MCRNGREVSVRKRSSLGSGPGTLRIIAIPVSLLASSSAPRNKPLLMRNRENAQNAEKTLEWSTIIAVLAEMTVLTFLVIPGFVKDWMAGGSSFCSFLNF